jgi:hypothetical protein
MNFKKNLHPADSIFIENLATLRTAFLRLRKKRTTDLAYEKKMSVQRRKKRKKLSPS